jgi:hypothetical protein
VGGGIHGLRPATGFLTNAAYIRPEASRNPKEATCSAWLAAQDQLATVLGARHITDTNSGHFIQGEHPN